MLGHNAQRLFFARIPSHRWGGFGELAVWKRARKSVAASAHPVGDFSGGTREQALVVSDVNGQACQAWLRPPGEAPRP
jgi:hypothetical protein